MFKYLGSLTEEVRLEVGLIPQISYMRMIPVNSDFLLILKLAELFIRSCLLHVNISTVSELSPAEIQEPHEPSKQEKGQSLSIY